MLKVAGVNLSDWPVVGALGRACSSRAMGGARHRVRATGERPDRRAPVDHEPGWCHVGSGPDGTARAFYAATGLLWRVKDAHSVTR